MHQAIHDWESEASSCCFDTSLERTYGRATRCRPSNRGPCSSGAKPGLGLSVLTSDPLIETVYRAGLLSLRDLRALVGCTGSKAISSVAQERARLQINAAAGQLRGMRVAFEVCAARVRALALDAEARLLQLGVPMNAVHPELSSPVRQGEASHHALYAGLLTLSQVLRSASHPASWAEQPGSVWEAVAASAGLSMRPQLVLLLSSLLPVECRMSYLALRHEAYTHSGAGIKVCDLGGLVKSVLLRMMLYPYGPNDLRRLTKQLKQVAPRLSPFSFWLLRQCAAGSGACGGVSLAKRHQQRADDAECLAAQIDSLFEQRQEQVLYSGDAWVGWLHGLPTRHLVAFYIKYLFDSFQ